MLKAEQALLLSLENDHVFKLILDFIKNATRSGNYEYTYTDYNNQPMNKFVKGLILLGYKVEQNANMYYISWDK